MEAYFHFHFLFVTFWNVTQNVTQNYIIDFSHEENSSYKKQHEVEKMKSTIRTKTQSIEKLSQTEDKTFVHLPVNPRNKAVMNKKYI